MSEHVIVPVGEAFQVCHVERTVLGTFSREADAALFRDALTARDRKPEPAVRCLSNPVVEPASPVRTSPPASDVRGERFLSEAHPAFPPDRDNQSDLEPGTGSAAPGTVREGPTAKTHPVLFAQAEARLIDGDELKQVATETGIPMTRLRGWWASRKKSSGDGSAPADVARRPPDGLSDADEDELLRICRADDPGEGLRTFAASRGRSVGDCRRLADKLLARGA